MKQIRQRSEAEWCNAVTRGVASFFWKGGSIWSEATDGAVCSASEAAHSAADRAGVRGRSLRWGFGGEAPNGGLGGQSPPEIFWRFWTHFKWGRC